MHLCMDASTPGERSNAACGHTCLYGKLASMPTDPISGVYYALIGEGPPLMIGLPLFASHVAILGEEARPTYEGWLRELANYRLCLVDYPGIGCSADMAPEVLTPERVCADLQGVADHAGFGHFAFFGHSWSGSVGLQLLARTERLSALVVGGWPPLDPPHAALLAAARERALNVPSGSLRVLRSADQYRQWITWNEALETWDGRSAPRRKIPKLAIYGADGDLIEEGRSVPIASLIRGSRPELETRGWEVVEVPGYGHEIALHPEVMGPPVHAFLDRSLAR